MTTKTGITRTLVGGACAVLALTGCSGTIAGTPTPVTSSSAASTSTSGADIFANLNPCQVLDQVLAGQGFNPGERKTTRNECGALKPGLGTYGLALDPVQGLVEFTQTDPSAVKIDVNGRNALQATTQTGGCTVAIEVSAHARASVDVHLSRTTDLSVACSNAVQFAQQVEPLLPKMQ
ncbi:DUF3558 family protein [Amycolatopsis taiwanensis]|uniref:DUF3558 family protein n=1 Tax=Amycolatopsis taiwanensis TaxID=342230 RepID=UPI000A001D78|nr:DUF3558 family protein [Amycolatopsis taiwanensis]